MVKMIPQDSKDLHIKELLNRLHELGSSSSESLKESPASSIVRTGQGGSRKVSNTWQPELKSLLGFVSEKLLYMIECLNAFAFTTSMKPFEEIASVWH